MPNYNLVIDSTFQPFSFEEMLTPVMLAQQAHQEVENAYTDLSIKAGEYKALAESEKLRNGENSETYKRYSSYADDLSNQANALMRNGLTGDTRSKLLELKRRYSTDIDPIRKAAERHLTLSDNRRQQEIANPTLRYERGYEEVGVDELLLNPNLDYGKSYSGALIEQQVASAASTLAKVMRDDPKGWYKILGSQYYQKKIQEGYTPQEVLLASLGDSSAPIELQELMNKAVATSGVESWDGYYDSSGNITRRGQSILSDVRSFAGRGLNNAIGTYKYDRLSNKAYDYMMQAALKNNKSKVETPTKNPPMDTKVTEEEQEKINKIKKAFPEGVIPSKYTQKETWLRKSPSPEEAFNEVLNYPLANAYNNATKSVELPVYGVDYGAMRSEIENINPLEEYKKAQEYQRATSANAFIPPGSGVRYNSMLQNDPYLPTYSGNIYETTYNTPVISKDQYDVLKELGYTEKSTQEDFAELQKRIDESIKKYTPISINLSNYQHEGDLLIGRINEDNMTGNIYEYEGDVSLMKEVDYSDIFKKDDNGTIKLVNDIQTMGIDPYNLEYLIAEAGGKRYSIRGSVLYPEVMMGIASAYGGTDAFYNYYKNAPDEEKERIVQALSFIYQKTMNSYRKRAPQTSSQETYGTIE